MRRQRTIGTFFRVAALVGGVVMALPSVSHAAIDEIIVTAERREASLQEVPIAVSVITETALKNQQVYNVENIGAGVPSMQSGKATGSPSNVRIYMRGLGNTESTLPTGEGAVGIYVDDLYLARTNGSNMRLLDVERIEVLRGPQGTLYGRNTISGAVKMITRKPDENARASATVGYGSRNSIDTRIGGSTPFADNKWAISAAAVYAQEDGFIDLYSAPGVKTGDKGGDRDYKGVRTDIRYMGSERFEALLGMDFTRDESDAMYATPIDANKVPLTGGDLYSSLTKPYSPQTGTDQYVDNDAMSAALTLTWRLDGFTVKAISGYREIDYKGDFDISGSNKWRIYTGVNGTEFSQELQALGTSLNDRLEWIVGAFYMYEDSDVDTTSYIGPNRNRQVYNTGLNSYAVFSQGTYRVTEKLGITLGGRYTKDEKTYDATIIAAGPPSWVSGRAVSDASWSEFTPKIGLDYHFNDDIMAYAYAAKGFMAGGYQARPFSVVDIDTPYDPTTVWTYEAGVKAELLDKMVRLNVAYFYSDYKNLQLNSLNTVVGGGTIQQNAGESRLDGIEVEITANPVQGLNVFGTLYSADGKYKKLPVVVSGVNLDSDIGGAPEFTAGLGFDYTLDLAADNAIVIGGDYNHRESYFPGPSNSEVIKVPTLNLYNAFVRYESSSKKWDVGIYGKNLSNRKYHLTGFNFSSFQSLYAADPLTVMGMVNIRFE